MPPLTRDASEKDIEFIAYYFTDSNKYIYIFVVGSLYLGLYKFLVQSHISPG